MELKQFVEEKKRAVKQKEEEAEGLRKASEWAELEWEGLQRKFEQEKQEERRRQGPAARVQQSYWDIRAALTYPELWSTIKSPT